MFLNLRFCLYFWFGLENNHSFVHLHKLSFFNANVLDLAVVCGTNEELHLHGFDRDQRIIGLDFLSRLAINLYDCAGHGALHEVLLAKVYAFTLGEELFLLNMDLKRCAFLVKAEDLIGLRVKEIGKRELFGVGSHEELVRLLRVLYDFSISKYDFGLFKAELVLFNQHIEAIFRDVLNLELMILILGIDQYDLSLGFVVDSEVIICPPRVDGGLSAESVVLILKPDVSEGNGSEALVLCLQRSET